MVYFRRMLFCWRSICKVMPLESLVKEWGLLLVCVRNQIKKSSNRLRCFSLAKNSCMVPLCRLSNSSGCTQNVAVCFDRLDSRDLRRFEAIWPFQTSKELGGIAMMLFKCDNCSIFFSSCINYKDLLASRGVSMTFPASASTLRLLL